MANALPKIGDILIERYRLTHIIGQGGMARVFRAVLQGPAGFEKTVAIKLLKATINPITVGKLPATN